MVALDMAVLGLVALALAVLDMAVLDLVALALEALDMEVITAGLVPLVLVDFITHGVLVALDMDMVAFTVAFIHPIMGLETDLTDLEEILATEVLPLTGVEEDFTTIIHLQLPL